MNQISVVIPATEFDYSLQTCLMSLKNQNNIQLDVRVIFNPSIPRFDKSIWPDWFQFDKSRVGVNCARNVGMRKAKSDLILFLDSDCELINTDHLSDWLHFMNQNQSVTGVGGLYRVNQSACQATKAYNFLQMDWLMQQITSDKFRTQALIGGHMLLRKSKLRGLEFDEKIIFGGSEKEFFIRLQHLKPELYLDMKSYVLHHSQLNFKKILYKAKAQGLGEKYIRRQHGKQNLPNIKYIIKPQYDPQWFPFITAYQRLFSQYSGSKRNSYSTFKKLTFRFIEHLNIAQSKRD